MVEEEVQKLLQGFHGDLLSNLGGPSVVGVEELCGLIHTLSSRLGGRLYVTLLLIGHRLLGLGLGHGIDSV